MGEARRRRQSQGGTTVPDATFAFGRAAGDAAFSLGAPVLLRDTEVVRAPGPGFDPFRVGRPRLERFLAARYPSAPVDVRWRVCGGFILHVAAPLAEGTPCALAFRLPDAPHFALLNVLAPQDPAALSGLRAATSTDGLTVTGAFEPAGEGQVLRGTVEPFAFPHTLPEAGLATLLLPDWDAASFRAILRPFGLDVRTG